MGEHKGLIAAAAITATGGIITAVIGAVLANGGSGASGGDGVSLPTTTQTSVTVPSLSSSLSTLPTVTFPSTSVAATRTSLFLNRDSGAGGTTVLLSGEGFAPNDRIRFRLHTEHMGTTTANAEGRFANVAMTIPRTFSDFAPQQFEIVAQGESPRHSARAPFTVTG